MPRLTADRLLADVDPLSHPLRLRTVARTAAALDPGARAPLLAELAAHGPYGRRLAALAAFAGRDTAWLTEHLTDPDRVVRRYAHRAIRALPVPDEAVARAVLTAGPAIRDELVRTVLRARRAELAERLLPALRERWGAAAAAPLLPLCPPAVVARELPVLAHAFTFTTTLGRRHPDAVLDLAAQELAELPFTLRPTYWEWHAPGLAAAAGQRPLRALELLERHPPRSFPGPLRDRLPDLAAVDADRTVRLLLTVPHDRHVPPMRPALVRALSATDLTGRARLGRRNSADLLALLRALPAEQRAGLLDLVAALPGDYRYWDRSDVLATLPPAERWARARALLAEEPGERHWLALLPTEEARPRLLEPTHAPDPEERGYAWLLVVSQAAHSGDPATVTEALELLGQLRNEQDPVRNDALRGLGAIPVRLLEPAAAGPLDRITDDALAARDCSPGTRIGLGRFVLAVLGAPDAVPEITDWAARTFARLRPAALPLPPLALPPGPADALVERLRPALERSAATPDAELLLAVADALGARTRRSPVLLALLEGVLRTGGDAAFDRAAGHLLADPAGRADRVEAVLALEPSAATRPAVQAVLTRHRTDLLDALLTPAGPGARFAPARPDTTAADRWTPAQHRAAADLLAAGLADPDRPLDERAALLAAAAPLPTVGLDLLHRYAGSPDTVLAEAALAALPWTEHPADTLPALLAHAGDDRARVALAAAGRAARYAAADLLAPALHRIAVDPAAKVTSRKQAVRLAADRLPVPEGAALLRAAHRMPGQHPDVRRAVITAALARLADLALWDVLTEAADGPSWQRTPLLGAVRPHELPAADRPRFAALLARLLTDPDHHDVADPARREFTGWVRHAPEAVAALAAPVTALGLREGWRAAAGALATVAHSDAPHPLGGCAPGSVLADTLAALVAAVRSGEPARPGRDQPARQRIETLAQSWYSFNAPAVTQSATRWALGLLLADEPSLLPTAVPVLVTAISPDAPDAGGRLLHLARLLRDRPVLAATAAEHLRRRSQVTAPTGAALATARLLRTDGGTAAGLFAVTVVAGGGRSGGWSEDWRNELAALRSHPRPDVRDAALAVFTDPE
ncbi:hypothetical protein ACGFX4_18210 [Kitasatospora sp. NPDC048365]|uniref:hypothetical protein n=1 Tax=Kitasatospora sp. NPDC048365 TaxID=3364050 RepID=UPI003721F47B